MADGTGVNWKSFKTIIELVTAIIVLLGAVLGVVLGLRTTGGSGSHTATNSTPSPTHSFSSPSATRHSAASSSPPSVIPIITPRNDPGFDSAWHGSVTVDAAGVRVTASGIYQANQEDYDVLYRPGSSDDSESGWQENANNRDLGSIFYWTGNGTPDPAACYESYEGMQIPESPSVAKVGDEYCYVDASGVIGYMQATSVDANGVNVQVWLWKKT